MIPFIGDGGVNPGVWANPGIWAEIARLRQNYLPEWKDFLNRIAANRKALEKKLEKIPHADVIMAENLELKGGTVLKHKFYYKESEHWVGQTDTVVMSSEKIPEYLREKIAAFKGEVDITDEIDRELAAQTTTVNEVLTDKKEDLTE